MEKHNRHLKSGFTLVEILISFGIFALLMGIVLSGFMETRKLERLRQSAAELVSALQKAQNYALTGYALSGVVPLGGYGVHFNLDSSNPENSEYFIFSDTYSLNALSVCDSNQGNQRYDNLPAYPPVCNEPNVGGKYLFKSGVVIHKILVSGSAIASPVIDITFKSPLRMPYVGTETSAEQRNPSDTQSESVDILLKWKDKDFCRKVSVKKTTGQITEEAAPCN